MDGLYRGITIHHADPAVGHAKVKFWIESLARHRVVAGAQRD
jgi:hypothetical protein